MTPPPRTAAPVAPTAPARCSLRVYVDPSRSGVGDGEDPAKELSRTDSPRGRSRPRIGGFRCGAIERSYTSGGRLGWTLANVLGSTRRPPDCVGSCSAAPRFPTIPWEVPRVSHCGRSMPRGRVIAAEGACGPGRIVVAEGASGAGGSWPRRGHGARADHAPKPEREAEVGVSAERERCVDGTPTIHADGAQGKRCHERSRRSKSRSPSSCPSTGRRLGWEPARFRQATSPTPAGS